MKIAGYQYGSCFGPYIQQFIEKKRSIGFIYEHEEWELKHFDRLCCEKGVSELALSRALVMEWGQLRENEFKSTSSSRFSVIRQFGLYLLSLDLEAYLPSNYSYSSKGKTHVLSDEEIAAVFKIIDQRQPVSSNPDFWRLSLEYKVILRLIYCCGLRISEARLLKNQDVDLNRGTLRIMQSKGHKDRLVYLAPDMKQLLLLYHNEIISRYKCRTEWFFPGRYPERPLPVVTIDMVFRDAWNQTSFAKNCDKAPTVHSLRHTFVVKRMNIWMEQGVSLKEMLPYLSRYLGHTSPNETFYYYHQVDSAFKIVRQRDKSSSSVIPEVVTDEKG
jgi:integrase